MTATTALVLGGIVLLLLGMGVVGYFNTRRPSHPPAPAPADTKPSDVPADSPWPKTTLASIDAAVTAEAPDPDVRGITLYNPSKNPYDV